MSKHKWWEWLLVPAMPIFFIKDLITGDIIKKPIEKTFKALQKVGEKKRKEII